MKEGWASLRVRRVDVDFHMLIASLSISLACQNMYDYY